MVDIIAESERLLLRQWRETDLDPFAAMGRDPEVMATLGALMDRDSVAASIARMQRLQAELGHCFWALERKADGEFLGWCGLIRGNLGTPVADQPEIGWRLARAAWGKGYASEAARAATHWGFANLADDSIWAITTPENRRSRAVMDRLGMHYREDMDFDHPGVPADDPLLQHVTYQLSREDWEMGQKTA